jgi:hypothetical protein
MESPRRRSGLPRPVPRPRRSYAGIPAVRRNMSGPHQRRKTSRRITLLWASMTNSRTRVLNAARLGSAPRASEGPRETGAPCFAGSTGRSPMFTSPDTRKEPPAGCAPGRSRSAAPGRAVSQGRIPNCAILAPMDPALEPASTPPRCCEHLECPRGWLAGSRRRIVKPTLDSYTLDYDVDH